MWAINTGRFHGLSVQTVPWVSFFVLCISRQKALLPARLLIPGAIGQRCFSCTFDVGSLSHVGLFDKRGIRFQPVLVMLKARPKTHKAKEEKTHTQYRTATEKVNCGRPMLARAIPQTEHNKKRLDARKTAPGSIRNLKYHPHPQKLMHPKS